MKRNGSNDAICFEGVFVPLPQSSAGVTNLFETESYFMGTEPYEGHPVLYTLLN
jgi:hypothetical protein